MANSRKKLLALLASTMLVSMLALVACGGNTNDSANSPASASDASSSAAATSSEAQQTEPFGKPWLVSIVEGNIPEAAPDAKDDLYLSLNYDSIAGHQGEVWINATAYTGELAGKDRRRHRPEGWLRPRGGAVSHPPRAGGRLGHLGQNRAG